MESGQFSVDGHQLRTITVGDPANTPVLMVHGWFLNKGMWRSTMDALSGDHYCVALDLLGFGDSDKPKDGDYSIAAQGRRVLTLADHLGIDRFILIGHSMGGQIVTCIASMLAPERVIKLVNVDGVMTGKLMPFIERVTKPFVAVNYRMPMVGTVVRTLAQMPWYARRMVFPTWFHDPKAIPYEDWAEHRALAMQPGMNKSLYHAGQAIRKLNLVPHLPNVTAPALAIYGEYDTTVPVGDGHRFTEHVPGAKLVIVEDCGHFPMWEKPDDYERALLAFLGDGTA